MRKILIIAIFILAFFLRVWNIDLIPASLYWDEVAIGYNAYSLLKTGADEYGNKLPVLIRSFDDNKPSGMVYSAIPFIAIFGLNEWGVRFPLVILGTITVISFYFLLQILFRKENLSLWGSLLLAISPWHLQFSRAAFEANGGFCFFVLFITFLSNKNNRLAMLSSIAAMYFYHAYWFIVPGVWIYWFFQNKQDRKIILYGLLTIPLIISIIRSGYQRPWQVSLGNQEVITSSFNESRGSNNNNFISKIFYNNRLIVLKSFAENYFSHFSPQFLFFQGDTNERHKVLGMGLFYLWESFTLCYGIWYLFHWQDKRRSLIFVLLFLTPIPASVSYPAPHALRGLPLLLPLMIINSLGVYKLMQKTKRLLILIPVIAFLFVNYLVLYYDHTPRFTSRSWGYGYKESFREVNKLLNDYDRILYTGHYWKPYIYYLFYNQIDPVFFQKNHNEKRIGKIEFTGTSWANNEVELDKVDIINESKRQKTLFVLSDKEYINLKRDNWLQKETNYQPNLKMIKIIKDLQGKEMFYILEII